MSTSGGREHWGSGLGFVLAAAGSAVGLGNIWQFPYVTGQNGGGAFVLIYLLCIVVIGMPVMLCELVVGRHTHRNPVGAFRMLSPKRSLLAHTIGAGIAGLGVFFLVSGSVGFGLMSLILGAVVFRCGWVTVGGMGVVTGFLILSFYSVVGGWTLGYLIHACTGGLDPMVFSALSHDCLTAMSRPQLVELSGIQHDGFIMNPWWAVGCQVGFMGLCVGVVYRGVQAGIERWSKILMPTLFILLLVLIGRSVTLPEASRGIRFFLSPDFSKITPASVIAALGLAFFSLSLGMGALATYGSYLRRDQNLFRAVLSVTCLDTLVALLAGLAIFPAAFAMGFEPNEGPALVFKVLPAVFNSMPAGRVWAALFFALLLVAALTSGISMFEVVVAYFVDERRWTRRAACIVVGIIITLIGALATVSVADWSCLQPLARALTVLFGAAVPPSLFLLLITLVVTWLLPLGGLCFALFVGWIWGPKNALTELRHGSGNVADVHLVSVLSGLREDHQYQANVHVVTLGSVWGLFIRFISPVAVAIAFLDSLGWLRPSPTPEPEPPPAEQVQPADRGQ